MWLILEINNISFFSQIVDVFVVECKRGLHIVGKKGATRGLPKRSPILVLLSPKHALLRSSDGIRCVSAGMIAPVNKGAVYT